MCVDKDGDLYVADSLNDRVQVFNSDSEYVTKFLGEATLSRSGRVYLLANPKPMRLREMTKLEAQKSLRRPRSVVVGDDGMMFIPDYGSYRVQIYQKDAVSLTENQIFPPLRSPTLATT
jgi:DNA-binding beta-propeller fold protein YncE